MKIILPFVRILFHFVISVLLQVLDLSETLRPLQGIRVGGFTVLTEESCVRKKWTHLLLDMRTQMAKMYLVILKTEF